MPARAWCDIRGERLWDLAEDVGFVKVPEIVVDPRFAQTFNCLNRPNLVCNQAGRAHNATNPNANRHRRLRSYDDGVSFSPKRDDDRIVEKPDASRSSIGSDGNLFYSGARSCTGA